MGDRSVVVLQAANVASEQERELAQRLSLPLLSQADVTQQSTGFYLQFLPAGLSLSIIEGNAPGPLTIDFNNPRLLRRSRDPVNKQDLGKAIGLSRYKCPKILDATAGTGTDGFILAAAGCSVTLLDRSEIVHALLADALARGANSPEPVASAVDRMQLQRADFLQYDCADTQFDVVYLDPMFPDNAKSARSQKSMYMLQQLLGKEEDETQLLAHGLALAGRRVVVKRNRKSPQMPGPDPDIQFKGSSSRYDVYLVNSGRS